ncbi:MAG: permease [Chitinophagales bacterium]|nr:MAG: permease [Chitinophagales bacterium]
MNKLTAFFKTLGPGVLFASTAIGVSHLVQSTRAGADYGFALLWAVILANVFKFPFFEYGSRYANATGTSIIEGYKKIGRWMLALYFLITVCSMFFVTAAVGAVTAGFLDNLFGISAAFPGKPLLATTLLFIVCLGILAIGRFAALDLLIKLIGTALLISTLAAFIITLIRGPVPHAPGFTPPPLWDEKSILFIIALMGWMPTAVDLSSWNSLWTLERIKQSGYKPTLRETLVEFNLGYWISAALSICFVTLGAYILYGTGQKMPDNSALFANEVVELYTATMGSWSYFIIATSAFSIMFSTSIGVFDGYARALERTSELLFFSEEKATLMLKDRKVYLFSLFSLAIGAYLIISVFSNKMKALVDLATSISFLIAPVIAVVNFRLVKKHLQPECAPGWALQILSYAGIAFLTGFSILYLIARFIPEWLPF